MTAMSFRWATSTQFHSQYDEEDGSVLFGIWSTALALCPVKDAKTEKTSTARALVEHHDNDVNVGLSQFSKKDV